MDQTSQSPTFSDFVHGMQQFATIAVQGMITLKKQIDGWMPAIIEFTKIAREIITTLQSEFPRFVVQKFSKDLITDHRHISLSSRKEEGWNIQDWRDISIAIINEDLTCVIIADTFTIINHTDIGLCDFRNGKANTEWKLLEQVSQTEISYKKTNKKDIAKRQRKHRLDKKLQYFFGIQKSAFEPENYRENYKTKFPLRYIGK